MINIDKLISNFKSDEIVNITEENPPLKVVFEMFINNPNLKAVRYLVHFNDNITIDSDNVFYDKRHNKYLYKYQIQRDLSTDVIANISYDNDDTKLLFDNNQEIDCNVNYTTLPISNMMYLPIHLNYILPDYISSMDINVDIKYDVYMLENKLRRDLISKKIVNNEKMVFYNGTFDGFL